MTTPNEHPVDRLAEFVANRLDPAEMAAVRSHLDACASCARDLAGWRAVGEAASARAAAHAAPAGLAAAVAARIAAEARDDAAQRRLSRRLAWLWSFVRAQVPLVRREIWPATLVIMAIGAAISLLTTRDSVPGAALSLFAPVAAALGIALIYGQENDPGLELAVATPTSPRLVVVARLVVVLAWDLALALAGSLVLAVFDGPSVFMPLVSLWLGPMLLLGAATLLVSLFVGSSVAIAAAAVVWALRGLEMSGEPELNRLAGVTAALDTFWQTSPATVIAAAILIAVALLFMPARASLPATQAS